MIVPMKKVSLLVMDKNRENALQSIRDLGVIHLERKTVSSPALTELLNRRTQLENATGVLSAFAPKKKVKTKEEPAPFAGDLPANIKALLERRNKLQDYIFNHQREKGRFERWGDFNPKDFEYFTANGVNAYLYELTLDFYKNDKRLKDVPFFVFHEDQKEKIVRILALEKIPEVYPWPLPERSLSVVNERNNIRIAEMAKIENELASLYQWKAQLDALKKANLMDIEFETARAGMVLIDEDDCDCCGADLSVSWISGYVPISDLGSLKRAASENGWALCADDPAEDDMEVPTKLKNNSFVSLIYPLTSFLDISPGYREIDVSGWFLVFFTLFFAMLFGDAGYGTIMLLISIVVIFKTMKKGVPVFFKFLLLTSSATVIWGILTCSWFCLDPAILPKFLQDVSLPLVSNASSHPGWLADYNSSNLWIKSGLVASESTVANFDSTVTLHLMLLCFSIALVHLAVARILKAIKARSLKSLAAIGQLSMLIGMYFVVLSLAVYRKGFAGVESWQLICIFSGFALVFLFGSYEGNFGRGILSSCTNIISLILSITGVFSDIMSYIRLWAVAVAGVALATTINGGASSMLGKLSLFVFGILLFLVGHVFNMVLCALAVLVHGVRLNTLEFSSGLELGWVGFAYKPFAKR